MIDSPSVEDGSVFESVKSSRFHHQHD